MKTEKRIKTPLPLENPQDNSTMPTDLPDDEKDKILHNTPSIPHFLKSKCKVTFRSNPTSPFYRGVLIRKKPIYMDYNPTKIQTVLT